MIQPEYLDWDSRFFGKKIGRITLDQAIEEALNIPSDYDLVYVFDEGPFWEKTTLDVPEMLVRKVDEKVVFFWKNEGGEAPQSGRLFDPEVEDFYSWDLPSSLEALAYQSGHRSRYFLDPGFTEAEFRRMYKTWIDKSLKRALADYLLVFRVQHHDSEEIGGFVTFRINTEKRRGTIGLIAVDERHRGKKIGSTLMEHIKRLCVYLQLDGFEVATQRDNEGACAFYRRNGCELIRQSVIYHLWRK
jgi:dTDP-4-amino-4,6-dideoxy-D-galactose acyltransferase